MCQPGARAEGGNGTRSPLQPRDNAVAPATIVSTATPNRELAALRVPAELLSREARRSRGDRASRPNGRVHRQNFKTDVVDVIVGLGHGWALSRRPSWSRPRGLGSGLCSGLPGHDQEEPALPAA